jgi:acyl transferase domain-containing protein/acyl carrier protein
VSDAAAVAIIGLAGRFPGAADPDEYWANLRAGICSIADLTEEELDASGVTPEERRRPDHVPAHGRLAGADRFEAALFGFPAGDAAVLDPQHRLALEAAWSALEDAGLDPRAAPPRTGVYLGGSLTEHMFAAHAGPYADELGELQLRMLTDREYLAAWVSYRLDLRGPSVAVQTACSTSLAAVHLAAQALLVGDCDLALAGGVSVGTLAPRGYRHRDGGVLSPDGRCRPFDERAAGTVPGSGVGVVVLRRLDDALAAGDPVRAVILGSAVTNDGAGKVGFAAPGVDGQRAAIAEAWAAAGLEPSAAQYLELHGTGTDLGDRIEIAAAAAALGPAPQSRCGIGSVKSNIGHLDAAAGIAGLVKVVQMLGHRTLAPTANVHRPHPALGLAATPFDLVTAAAPWPAPAAGPRLAGVSSIGMGGSNVHVVLAEAPPVAPPPPGPGRAELLPLSARTDGQVRAQAARLATALRRPDAPALTDVGHTLRAGRAALAHRVYAVATTLAEAVTVLEALAAGRPVPATPAAPELRAAGDAWVAGTDGVLPGPAPGARRVHLPTYPFAGPRWDPLPRPGTVTPAPPAAAAEPVEAALTRLLTTSLDLRGPEDLDKSYAAAGGDSLAAVTLAGRIRDDLGVDVPVEVFLEPSSLRGLVSRIAAIAGDGLLASLLDEAEAGT